ncbi:hypothetical protein KAX29_07685 [candidate division WOR-3 bacterium]|nr:hypothetical protein [candidate division WOR-3 bacterium]
MKGLLLRVGIDIATGDCIAPIFEDGSFEYIPIPELQATSESRMYANMKGINGRAIVEFVPEKIKYCYPHYNPEFTTYTFGDSTKIKRNQLSKLSPGDPLLFYAKLKPLNSEAEPRLYVIGYFVAEKIYDFKKIKEPDYPSVFQELENNAYAKRYFKLRELNMEYREENLIIVKGKQKISKLFKKALPLGDFKGNIRKDLIPTFGYEGSLSRAVGHWIKKK